MSEFWDIAKGIFTSFKEASFGQSARLGGPVTPLLDTANQTSSIDDPRNTYVINGRTPSGLWELLRNGNWAGRVNAMTHDGEADLLRILDDTAHMQESFSRLATHSDLKRFLGQLNLDNTVKRHMVDDLYLASDLYNCALDEIRTEAINYKEILEKGLRDGGIAVEIQHGNSFQQLTLPDEVLLAPNNSNIHLPFTFRGGNRLFYPNGSRVTMSPTPRLRLIPLDITDLIVQSHGDLHSATVNGAVIHDEVANAGMAARNLAKQLMKQNRANKGFKKAWLPLFIGNLQGAFEAIRMRTNSPAIACLIGIGIAGALMAHSSNAHANEESAHPVTESSHDDGMNIANFALHGVLGFISPEAEMGLTVAEMVGLA